MLVATAGHVDHGKTALIKALTGVDTDRLPEEKQRGLSIDLGFAYHDLGGGEVLGFVDVPGHERFVRNMAAGVAAIDYALLVVAADDGPMPQTREHLAILELLGVPRGAVAISKIDRVDEARVDEVKAAVRSVVAGTALANAEIYPVSGLTGAGVENLRDALLTASDVNRGRDDEGNFRLAIDRSFTVSGAGLVVTGAVMAGHVSVGDQLLLSPQGVSVRVRGLRALDRETDTGVVGQRCALNITGPDLRRVEVKRGDWIVAPEAHAPARRFDARLTVLADEPRPLTHWTPVHVHAAASDVTGRVAILGSRRITPGETGLAQLVLDQPIGALHGDRFILRDQSARRTIAGGMVLDPFPPPRGRARPARLTQLEALAAPTPAEALALLLTQGDGLVDLDNFATAWNLTPEAAEALWRGHDLMRITVAGRAVGLSAGRWQALRDDVLDTLGRWHARHPDSLGPEETDLRRTLSHPVANALMAAAVARLLQDGALRRDGLSLRLPDHRAEMTPEDAALWRRVEPLIAEGGIRPPRVRELAADLDLEIAATEGFLGRAARLGHLLRVAPNRYFPPAAVHRLAEIAEETAAQAADGLFSAAEYRDRSSIGRNLTIEVLEFLDAAHVTRRIGERRRILQTADEAFGRPAS